MSASAHHRIASTTAGLLIAFLLVGAVASVPAFGASGGGGEEGFRSLTAEGPLTGVAEHTGRMARLRVKDGLLRLDRDAIERMARQDERRGEGGAGDGGAQVQAQRLQIGGGGNIQIQGQAVIQLRAGGAEPQPIEQLFTRLQAAANGRSSQMASMGDRRQRSFQGESLGGVLEIGDRRIRLSLEEVRGEARRTLELLDDPDGLTRLLLTSRDGELVLINQSPDGTLRVVVIEAQAARVMGAPDFKRFYQQHGDWFDQVLAPSLEKVGVHSPLTPGHAAVIDAVLARLRPDDQQRLQRGRELIEALDDDAFATREQATEQLIASFAEFRDLIAQSLADQDISAEMRMRLEQVVRAQAEDGATAAEVVGQFDLLDDAAYLVGLLERADADDRPHIAARLQQVTGQDHGEDVEPWQRWLERQ